MKKWQEFEKWLKIKKNMVDLGIDKSSLFKDF